MLDLKTWFCLCKHIWKLSQHLVWNIRCCRHKHVWKCPDISSKRSWSRLNKCGLQIQHVVICLKRFWLKPLHLSLRYSSTRSKSLWGEAGSDWGCLRVYKTLERLEDSSKVSTSCPGFFFKMSFTASFRVVVTYFKGVSERVPLILKSRLGPGGRHSEILSFVSVKEELQDVDGCEVFRNGKH